MRRHSLDGSLTHCRWNNQLSPILEIESGDVVEFHCPDASGGQIQKDSTIETLRQIDRDRIHTIVGPVFVKGAVAGDVLEVSIERVQHLGWGWTSLIPGLGLLREEFLDYDLFIWDLEEQVTRSLVPAVIPLQPFCGIMGVAPSASGELRTRPPGVFGGNLDVRDLGAGAKLFLPVQIPGALFSAGDAHAAQGDGEVCINGIEMPCVFEARFTLRREFQLRSPRAEVPPRTSPLPDQGQWLFISSEESPRLAAQQAVRQAIDFLTSEFGLSANHAYILCSVALNLRISQWVNDPVVTVTAALPKNLFHPVTA